MSLDPGPAETECQSAPVKGGTRCLPVRATGPVTAQGKAMARLNAVTHGLTANPTTFGLEDASAFESLREQLAEELHATGVLEFGIVHRMAIALWRLDRAAKIDGATTTRRVATTKVTLHHVDEFIARIHDAFRWNQVEERDPDTLSRAFRARRARPGEPWLRWKRTSVTLLEHLRSEMLDCAHGLRAMLTVMDRLWLAYRDINEDMGYDDLVKLAWLLGDHADTIPAAADSFEFADGRPVAFGEPAVQPGRKFELLRQARARAGHGAVPPEVSSMIEAQRNRLIDLIALRTDGIQQHEYQLDRTARLLPDAEVLERLQRYETAAERSLYRAIDALAKLRGQSREIIQLTVARTRAM